MYERRQESPLFVRRDAAFQDWALNPETVFKKNENGFSKADLQSAFNAGWKARKELDIRERHYADGVLEKFIPADGSKIVEHITIEMPENA